MATTDFVVKNGLVVTENAVINETTDASDKDTGALVVEGGVGIEKKLYVGTDLNVGNNASLTGDLAVNGGDLTTSVTTFNLLNSTATTLNIGGAATTIEIGAATGTTNINNDLDVDGDVNIDGGDLTVSSGTFNLANTTATTVNFAGAATDVQIGAATGTTNVNNNLTVDLDLTVKGGDITTDQTTFNLLNTTATTVNFAGAATDVQIGAATGTTNVNNDLDVDGDVNIDGGDLTVSTSTFNLANTTATTLNIGGAATTVEIGAASGTTNVNNNLTVDLDLAINGGDLTTSQTTFNLINGTATTVNFAGDATTLNLGATSGSGTTTVKNSFKVDGSAELGSSSVNSITINSGTINVPNSILLTKDDASASTVSYPIILRHTTNGSPATGIGTGVQFVTETANNNNEIGAIIESVSTSVVDGAENFDLVFKLMTNGDAASEKIRFTSAGNIAVNGSMSIGSSDLTTTQTTFNLINTNANTINFGGAATAINIGSAVGTTDIKNNLNVTGDLDIDGGDLTVSTTTFNLANTTATTVNFAGAATDVQIGAATGTTNVNNNLVVDLDLQVKGGDITTDQTTFNLINGTAATVNFAGDGTSITIGATSGTTTIRNANVVLSGDLDVQGGDLTTNQTTFNLVDTNATTVNFARASTSLTIGSTSGTTTIRTANVVLSGDLEVRGGDLTTNQTTFNLANGTATTVNAFGAATTINVGAAGSAGTLTIKNDNVILDGDLEIKGADLNTNQSAFNLINSTVTTVNFAGAATTVEIGAATGTTNVNNNLTVDLDLQVKGGDITTDQATFNLLNTNATTVNFAGAATDIQIGAATGTTNVNNALDVDGDVNVDGGDLTTSSGTFNLLNTTVTTVNFAGSATAVEIGATTGTTSVNNNLTVDGTTTLGNATGDTVTINANTVSVPNTVTITEDDATDNAVSYPVSIQHTTSGTPANGIGTGIQFVTETANNNNEIGVAIEAVVTDVTDTSEDFDLIFKTMSGGGAAAERIKINDSTMTVNTGLVELTGGTSNRIQWSTNGVAAPSFTTRSAGTKLVLYPAIGASTVDHALGVDNSVLWLSVPNNTSNFFRWYGGTTQAMELTGAGNLSVTGDVEIKGGDLTTDQSTFNLLNGTATTINFAGAADTLNIGKFGGTTVIAGNLTVNGTTTTINATELVIDDKNIVLGSVDTPTDTTADGGGITLKGLSDKTFNWIDATDSWTSSEHVDLASGKVYKINQTEVLSSTTLGAGIINSSLQTVGTIGTGVWQGTIIDSTYGGTGVNNGGKTLTLGGNFTHSGAHTLTLTTTGNTNVTLPTTGTLATTGNLSQFAATTSAQLAGVISDETGSGVLVFGTSPSFTTSVVTGSSSFDVFNTTATTINAFGTVTTLNVGNAAAAQTVTIGGSSTGASTYNFGTGVTAAATVKTVNVGTGGDASSTTNINIGSSNGGTVTINSGTLDGALTSQNVFNTVATTLNIGGAATAFNAGATTGTMTLNNPTIVGSQTTQNLFNTIATTVNFAGAATILEIGAATGTTNVNNNLVVDLDLQVKGGDLTTNQTAFNLLNTTATTVNFAGAATTLEIGAATGTTNINNNLDVDGDVNIDGGDLTVSTGTFNLANTTATTVNFAGAGTAISIGAASGTTTINNANTVITGDLAVNGADITTTATGASSIFNANTTTLNLAQAATTITMAATTGTTTIRNSLAVNGSATLGDASGDSVTINANTINTPNTVLFTVDDAVTNNISYPIKLQHTTSGTPVNGIGTGIQFITETSDGNNEIGSAIESVAVVTNSALETFDLIFKTMSVGTTATAKVWIKGDGKVGFGVSDPAENVEIYGGNYTKLLLTADTENGLKYETSNGYYTSDFFNSYGNIGIQVAQTDPGLANKQTGFYPFYYYAGGSNANNAYTKFDVNGTEILRLAANGLVTLSGDLAVNGGDITSTATTFNLLNSNVTTLNIGNAATAISIGAATGTTDIKNDLNVTGNLDVDGGANINNSLNVVGDIEIDGGDLTVSTATFNLANTTATTVNFAGAATALNIGAATGTTDIKNNLNVTGDLDIDGGDLTVSTTTFNLANATATTVNFAGAATDLQIGAATGTTEINNGLNVVGNANIGGDLDIDGGDLTVSTASFNLVNTTATTVNFAGASTALTIGATTGTATIRNATTTITGNANVNGGTLATSVASFDLINTTANTVNFAGASTALTIGATTGTTTIRNAASISGDLTIADKIIHSGDTNTAIRFPAADTVTIETNGSERVRIDSAGNVSIGAATNNVFDTVSGARPLVVQSASSSTTINSSTNAITISNSDTTANNTSQINFAAITGASTNQYSSAIISAIHGTRVNGQYPSGQLVFSTSSGTNFAPTEKMRITSNGNVLIGTATDNGTDKLQVNGSISATTLTSSIATGTAPFTVASTTRVSNLNVATAGTADTLTSTRTIWGQNFNGSANVTGALSGVTTLSMDNQLTSTLAAGTAPFVITSTTRVANLNVATAGTADTLTTTRTIWGQNFNGSANVTGALTGVTTLSMNNQLTSTLAAGTAPFVITSTTRVANLNVATAGTADTLTTPRNINGVSFNGSADITVADGTKLPLAGGTLTGKLTSTSGMTAWSATTPGLTTGNIHIGTSSATASTGGALTFGARDSSSGGTAQAGIYILSDSSYGTRMYLATTNGYVTGSITAMSISEAGVVAITRSGLTVAGDVTAYSSDKRLKTNTRALENSLDKVLALTGYTFDWVDKTVELGFTPQNKLNDIGLLAQDVEAVCPQAVAPAPFDTDEDGNSKSGDNYLTVKYEKLVPLLIEAIKEQDQKINRLEKLVEQLLKNK